MTTAPTTRKILVAVNENGIRMGETHSNAIFTDHEVELVRQLHEDGMTYEVIAEKFECSYSTVRAICQYKRRAATIARWKVLLIELPISLNTDEMDRQRAELTEKVKDIGNVKSYERPFIEKGGRKLQDADRLEIRIRIKEGASRREMATQFNVSIQTIHNLFKAEQSGKLHYKATKYKA